MQHVFSVDNSRFVSESHCCLAGLGTHFASATGDAQDSGAVHEHFQNPLFEQAQVGMSAMSGNIQTPLWSYVLSLFPPGTKTVQDSVSQYIISILYTQ